LREKFPKLSKMKIRLTLFTLLLSLISTLTYSQVGIGTSTPHSSSIVDVSATNKAFLLPRLTSGQRAGISSPANGLVIFCTNCGTSGEMQVYNGTAWKTVMGGTTALSPPALSTTAASNISYTTATAGGNVTYSETTVSARGVCWSTSSIASNQNISLLSTKTSDLTGTGSFTSAITGLTPNTTYYLRAYATNSTGTSYGTQESLITPAAIPASFATTTSSTITGYSATISSNITSNNGATVTSRGVCYSLTQSPTTSNNPQTNGSGNGAYDITITGLLENTTYYVRSYAVNSAGTSYSSEISITTGVRSLPTIASTTAISAITRTSASSGGNISSSGNDLLTARGICWSTSTIPDNQDISLLSTKTVNGTTTGTYTSSLTGLTYNTTYYVRAYATNSVGTTYGNQISFTTIPTLQGSLTFNGTNQYLNISPGLTFGTGAFTVEGWIYNTDALTTDGILGYPAALQDPQNTGACFMGVWNNKEIITTVNSATGRNTYNFIFTNAITTNAWHYFIYNRNANGLAAVFIDGVKSTTHIDANNYFGPSTWIGRNYWDGYWPGYITNLKVTIGAAIYDSNAATGTIANPTAELTATGTTKLLLLGNSATTDAAGVQTITNINSVGISTTIKPTL